MPVIRPESAEKSFAYSFKSLNDKHKPKLSNEKLKKETFGKIQKLFETLHRLQSAGVKWKDIPSAAGILYSGNKAHPIKEVKNSAVRDVVQTAFFKNEEDSSSKENYYPSYLAITREIRLFGYQWHDTFHVVLVDLNHNVHKE